MRVNTCDLTVAMDAGHAQKLFLLLQRMGFDYVQLRRDPPVVRLASHADIMLFLVNLDTESLTPRVTHRCVRVEPAPAPAHAPAPRPHAPAPAHVPAPRPHAPAPAPAPAPVPVPAPAPAPARTETPDLSTKLVKSMAIINNRIRNAIDLEEYHPSIQPLRPRDYQTTVQALEILENVIQNDVKKFVPP